MLPLTDIGCVIFDKDGTIVCFHAIWSPWAVSLADEISGLLARDLREQILQRLGVNAATMQVGPGLLAEGTKVQIADALIQLAVNSGTDVALAVAMVNRACVDCVISSDRLRFIDGTRATFERLREEGFKIGVCTSDDRAATEAQLILGGLHHLVDAIVCGDDADVEPKPHASGALSICGQVKVPPSRTVVVGDTATDMRLGINAGLAASIGVLSGIGDRSIVTTAGASHVLESVAALPALLGLRN